MTGTGYDHMQIYVIRHPEGYVKIGRSKNPEDRLEEFQAGSPYTLKLWITAIPPIHGGPHPSLERWLHVQFEEYRIHREWFNIPDGELLGLIEDEFEKEDGYVLHYVDRREKRKELGVWEDAEGGGLE